MSGLWYERLTDICHTATPKLFAFDYCASPRWYGETLQRWNPELSEPTILNALVEWLDLVDAIELRCMDISQMKNSESSEKNGKPEGIEIYGKMKDL